MEEFTFTVDPDNYARIQEIYGINAAEQIANVFVQELRSHFDGKELNSTSVSLSQCTCDKQGASACHCHYDYE